MDQKSMEAILNVDSADLAKKLGEALGTNVVFGVGALEKLHTLQLPGEKALVVISNGKSCRTNGSLDRLLSQLEKARKGAAVYDQVEANPVFETIDRGGEFCRQNGCDFVVALGGGSVIDCAKSIAVIAKNSGSIWDYVQAGSGGRKKVTAAPLPVVAIPTTAGTGSEVNCGASFSKVQTNEKIAFKETRTLPRITIIDPELTYSIPPRFTAYQGWDALTHSMEYLINVAQDDTCDYFAHQAIRLAGRALARAVAGDKDARADMALVSALSGYVIGHCGTCSQHALECAISGSYPGLPHGAGMLLLAKAYFGFIIEQHVCDTVFVDMAQLLGQRDATEAGNFLDAIEDILKDCHVDTLKMSDFGIDPNKFPDMVQNAHYIMEYCMKSDRRKISDDEFLEIYQRAYR